MRSAIAVLLVCVPCALAAYPIDPVTLWELVEEAELIVWADVYAVERPESYTEDEDGWPDSSTARLEVVDSLKGSAGSAIAVEYQRFLVCPAPPHFELEERVLAFLKVWEGHWAVVGLSYGTVSPDPAGLADYRVMVEKAEALMAAGAVTPAAKIAWAAEAASLSATRWDGLYLLERDGENLLREMNEPPGGTLLSPQQLASIAVGFLAAPDGRTLALTLRALRGFEDDALDAAAVELLDRAVAEEQLPGWFTVATLETARRLEVPGIPKLEKAAEALDWDDTVGRRALWRRVRADEWGSRPRR